MADSSGNTLASAVGGGSPNGGVGTAGQNVIARNGGSGGLGYNGNTSGGLPPSGSIPLPGSAAQGGNSGAGGGNCGPGAVGSPGNNGYALLTF